MADSDTYVPPPHSSRKWRWWHIALAVAGVVTVLSLLGGSGSPKLKVNLFREGAFRGVQITNMGDKAVTITGLVLNDRKDCTVVDLDQLGKGNATFKTAKLEIGESSGWFTNCQVVRAVVATSLGSGTYEFK